MNAKFYTFSQCISKAANEMQQANYYATKKGDLYTRVTDTHAEAAERWFAFARIANRIGSIKVATFFSGIPVPVN